jgi:hypothetical protein
MPIKTTQLRPQGQMHMGKCMKSSGTWHSCLFLCAGSGWHSVFGVPRCLGCVRKACDLRTTKPCPDSVCLAVWPWATFLASLNIYNHPPPPHKVAWKINVLKIWSSAPLLKVLCWTRTCKYSSEEPNPAHWLLLFPGLWSLVMVTRRLGCN